MQGHTTANKPSAKSAAKPPLPASLICATCSESTTFTTFTDQKTYCNRMHLITFDLVRQPNQVIETCTSWSPPQPKE